MAFGGKGSGNKPGGKGKIIKFPSLPGGSSKKRKLPKKKLYTKKILARVLDYNRVISLEGRQIKYITNQRTLEKDFLKKINLSIKLCGRIITKANAEINLFQSYLDNPGLSTFLGLKNNKAKINAMIIANKKLIAKQEKDAEQLSAQSKFSLKKNS